MFAFHAWYVVIEHIEIQTEQTLIMEVTAAVKVLPESRDVLAIS